MKLLELTIGEAAADVALDEALLEMAETGEQNEEVLRLWEPPKPMVVLGRSSPFEREVNRRECELKDIAVIRRCSGGASILTSPGCLMYAVVLSYDLRPQLRSIDNAHHFVMQKIQAAIASCGIATEFQGTCDLTIGSRKVSGNALRCKRRWFVYHGTLICQAMDLRLVSKCLGNPERQPEYRQRRSHQEFLTRIPTTTADLARTLAVTWNCTARMSDWPEKLTNQLVAEKYSQHGWNRKI